eukprot:TRINITY_DN10144_c0_g1_i1.p1 TRINITY_DN10144_c0_g1~~TRINITY_DN10144_c0_g1_i1.p1  ORF type:complete len:600 (-),score=99.87 TRINITY_DN10144_c0_g1_i1:151-1950(-)
MIDYSPDKWQVLFLFQIQGSVFPKGICWAVPSTVLAIILRIYVIKVDPSMSVSTFASFNFVLGFLVVFRSQQAYSRFWEASTIIQQVRGNWFNAASACCAFCSTKPEDAKRVREFKHSLVRLTSLLYCTALQQIAIRHDEAFEIINIEDFDYRSLKYLARAPEKTLVILQWIQQLLVQNHRAGVLDVAPPILTRAFQELSNGIVSIVDAQKITDVLFPFPYAQMVAVMLIGNAILTPFVLATVMDSITWCAVLNFISVMFFCCINYIAAEIEMPFGDDPNDLPLPQMMKSLNSALISLMDNHFSTCPKFQMSDESERFETLPCPIYLMMNRSRARFSIRHPSEERRLKASESMDRQISELMASSSGKAFSRSRSKVSLVGMSLANSPIDEENVDELEREFLAPVLSSKASCESMDSIETGQRFGLQESTQSSKVSPTQPLAPAQPGIEMLQGNPASPELTKECTDKSLFDSSVAAEITDELLDTAQPALARLLQTAGREIEQQLAELSRKVQSHFTTVSADLSFIAAHQGPERSCTPPEKPQLLRVSELLNDHLKLMVEQLDEIAAEAFWAHGQGSIMVGGSPILPRREIKPPHLRACS